MRATVSRWLFAIAGFALAGVAPAAACTLSEDYFRASNFEAVGKADTIVVATAREAKGDDILGGVVFDVAERVKGNAPDRVEGPGSLIDEHSILESADSALERVGGACGGGAYRRGERYLLLFETVESGQARRLLGAFPLGLRRREDRTVTLRTVRRYLRIQGSAPPLAQLAALARLNRTGRGLDGERLTAVEVADMRDHLSSLSPDKPTAVLLALYRALGAGAAPQGVERHGRDAESAARMLLDRRAGEPGFDVAAARRRVLLALVVGNHPEARPLFEAMIEARPEDPAKVGPALRFLARNGAYARAYAWIEGRLMNLLPQLDPRTALLLVADVADAQGQGDDEGTEPWRSDPRARATWPDLALSLYWYQVRTFGADEAVSFGEAIRALPKGDYRARPLLTLALAADYAEGVSDWAVAELRDGTKRKAFEGLSEEAREQAEDPARLPLQVLLSAWQQGHSKVLEEVFCQSPARRSLLIQTLGESTSLLYDDVLAAIAASALTEDERERFRSALLKWAVREQRMIDSGDSGHDVLVSAVLGEKAAGEGITCPVGAQGPQ